LRWHRARLDEGHSMILKKLLLATVAVGSITAAAIAQDWDKVEIRTEPLRGNLHVLYGAGGNIGISAGEDGVVLIDDQFAPLTDRIRAAVGKISDKPILYTINTHFHGDHTGGNENMGNGGTVLVAHDNVRQRLSKGTFIKAFNNKTEPQPKKALPSVTFNDEMSLHLNGEEARIIHVENGHTDGDSFIYFKETNLIHMGDLFFNELFPFIDVGNGGAIDGMIAGADKALAMADAETIVIPGHGPVTDKAGLAAYRVMLQETRDVVAEFKTKGMSLEEIRAAKPLEGYKEKWKSFNPTWADQYLGFVFASLK